MTEPLTMARDADALERVTSSSTDRPGVFRSLLANRLELGVAGLLTVVQASPGAGKTTGVATWASSFSAERRRTAVTELRGLVWLELDESMARPERFVPHLVELLDEAGLPSLPRLGLRDLRSRTRRQAVLTAMADALRLDGPWCVVLDNFPTGSNDQLGADLEFLLTNTGRALRVVVLADARPAMPLHRLAMAGEVTLITGSDLDLSQVEVAQVLKQYGIDPVESVVDAVLERTHGWAAGVRLAGQLLGRQPRAAALAAADVAIDDFLRSEILAGMPDDVRGVVERLSLVDSASDELAALLAGGRLDDEVARAIDHTAFVERLAAGQVRVHPVLRAVAARDLNGRAPTDVQRLLAEVARWYAADGDFERAYEAAAKADAWDWIGRTLVDRLAVPDILSGVVPPWAVHPEVLDREPVLRAAVDLTRGDVVRARATRSTTTALSAADAVSWSLVELAVAVATADTAVGQQLVAATRYQVDALPKSMVKDTRELISLVDACAGILALAEGELDSAARILTQVASASSAKRCSPVRREATAHLALVEAIRGNLARATAHADDVRTAAERFGGRAGISEATLARAWVHVERLDLDDARRLLDQLRVDRLRPLTLQLSHVLEVRMLTCAGEPEAAVRLAGAVRNDGWDGWSTDLAIVAAAQAWLAQGEPRRALEALTPEPVGAAIEARLVAAAARAAIGDLRGARALHGAVTTDLTLSPLPTQVEGWLLEARLVFEDGNESRARVLVDRALRAATGDGIRAPFLPSECWLRTFLGRDPALQRTHRSFVGSLMAADRESSTASALSLPRTPEQVLESLSERESQVLELLALMCSTDEIAAELYVSGNTVKTHVKSIFRKLGVNRRVDAVRVGRALGIC